MKSSRLTRTTRAEVPGTRGSAARSGVDQRELTQDPPGSDGLEHAPVPDQLDLAFDHGEHGVTVVAGGEEHFARLH